MYNGIGLQTPRGSGTSGYIQRNLSHVKERRTDFPQRQNESHVNLSEKSLKIRKVSKDLELHEKKRKIELQILLMKEELENQNLSSDEITSKLKIEREHLQAKLNRRDPPPDDPKSQESLRNNRRTHKKKSDIPW